MSDNNNTMLLVGAAVALYMLSKNNGMGAYPRNGSLVGPVPRAGAGRVKSMPSNVGAGWQQVGVGAVAGFLQGLAKGAKNNTPTTVIPSYDDPVDKVRGDVVQEGVDDYSLTDDYIVGDGDLSEWGYA